MPVASAARLVDDGVMTPIFTVLAALVQVAAAPPACPAFVVVVAAVSLPHAAASRAKTDNTTAHRNNRFTIRLLEIRTSGKVAPTELAPSVGREAYTRATQEGCLRFHPMTKASRPTSRHPTRQSWTPRLVLAVARPIPSPPVGAASATHHSTNRLSRRRPRARPSGLRHERTPRG